MSADDRRFGGSADPSGGPAPRDAETLSIEDWSEHNNAYLAASLAWLRLKLAMLSPGAGREAGQVAGPGHVADAGNLELAARHRKKLAATGFRPALEALAQYLGLSAFERDLLLLCAAAELEPALGLLMASAGGFGPRPNFALALRLFDEASWAALSPHGILRSAGLVQVEIRATGMLTTAPLALDERVLHYLKGLDEPDAELLVWCTPVDASAPVLLAPSQSALVDQATLWLRRGTGRSAGVVQLLGVDAGSKCAVATAISVSLGRRLFRLPTRRLPTQRFELLRLAQLWCRETLLSAVALLLEADGAGPDETEILRDWIERCGGVVLVSTRETPIRLGVPGPVLRVNLPEAHEQFEHWRRRLAGSLGHAELETAARQLAGQFRLSADDVETACTSPSDVRQLWRSCSDLALRQIGSLAQRVEARSRWDDLVLDGDSLQQLRRIAQHVRGRFQVYEEWGFAGRMSRGHGVSALFCGDSGTGKTLAAEVLAQELDLQLFRIDLSAVLSKYIGETEKNLGRLFDAAEHGGAILFFDEADALFGKRSEIHSSHDRYANIEVDYLLQRLENYRGLAILATNNRNALDSAFLRRLRFVVDFPFPGTAEREHLWRKMLPPQAPCVAIDFKHLARFPFSGGVIHNAVLNAAFEAANDGIPIDMAVLLAAVRGEMRKLGKACNEADFLLPSATSSGGSP